MASVNKKNKMKNSYVYGGKSLKEKDLKLKRLFFYNSAVRQKMKHKLQLEIS